MRRNGYFYYCVCYPTMFSMGLNPFRAVLPLGRITYRIRVRNMFMYTTLRSKRVKTSLQKKQNHGKQTKKTYCLHVLWSLTLFCTYSSSGLTSIYYTCCPCVLHRVGLAAFVPLLEKIDAQSLLSIAASMVCELTIIPRITSAIDETSQLTERFLALQCATEEQAGCTHCHEWP